MENKNKYVKLGLTLFLSLSFVVLLYMGLANLHLISEFFRVILSTLQPILIGLILAYLVAPIQRKIERALLSRNLKINTARTASVFISAFSVLLLVVLFLLLFLPQVISTIIDLASSLPIMLNRFVADNNLLQYFENDSQILALTQEAVKRFNEWFNEWIRSDFTNALNSVVLGVVNTFGFFVNLVVGFIVMIYVLFEKDHFCGQAKKILYALSKNKRVNGFVLDTVRQCDKMFGGFISGSILDSCIVGILCFLVLMILKVPYAPLVSLIVGITNIIPFFGPYIGGIPSALLILLADPMKCLEFIIFILILQQIDGNIIAPKILGQSTGLSPFWVLFSILIFGEIFGIIGMIIGVPLFATIYYVIKRIVEAELAAQKLPPDTEQYIFLDKLDNNNHATFLKEPENQKEEKQKKTSGKERDNE